MPREQQQRAFEDVRNDTLILDANFWHLRYRHLLSLTTNKLEANQIPCRVIEIIIL